MASMWLKVGRQDRGLENKAAGEKAVKKAIEIREVAQAKIIHTLMKSNRKLKASETRPAC